MKVRIDSLDKLFSEYVRRRAMKTVHGCERCLTGKTSYKQLQCSHFFGRAKKNVRYDEDNAAGLCFGCHQYFTSHPLEHYEWFKERLSDKPPLKLFRFELLMARANGYQKIDRELIKLYLEQKIKEVLDEPTN